MTDFRVICTVLCTYFGVTDQFELSFHPAQDRSKSGRSPFEPGRFAPPRRQISPARLANPGEKRRTLPSMTGTSRTAKASSGLDFARTTNHAPPATRRGAMYQTRERFFPGTILFIATTSADGSIGDGFMATPSSFGDVSNKVHDPKTVDPDRPQGIELKLSCPRVFSRRRR